MCYWEKINCICHAIDTDGQLIIYKTASATKTTVTTIDSTVVHFSLPRGSQNRPLPRPPLYSNSLFTLTYHSSFHFSRKKGSWTSGAGTAGTCLIPNGRELGSADFPADGGLGSGASLRVLCWNQLNLEPGSASLGPSLACLRFAYIWFCSRPYSTVV